MDELSIFQDGIRREIRVKQVELARNTKWQIPAAVRRNEKSIALRMAKLLCDHKLIVSQVRDDKGRPFRILRCNLCKTTVADYSP